MKQFEVTFSVYRQYEPGKATIGSSLTSGLKTTIQANNMGQARAMIEAQYGKNCSVHGIRPL
ncbi:hypothetical protein [Dechloromonas sp. A34]|uniref:hypothetical protein n=1 Tax=Dechloromonas sp. A34 TaxID=447588 RepID=UPI0022499655|nr:hypothetical protein [Dechloromonas sp. A34]